MPNRPPISAAIEREILLECGHRCAVCGDPLPLERAHIIPWHKSKEHKAEDLICLCANCHERADHGNWGEQALRKYKENPWVLRRYRMEEDGVGEPNTQLRVTINIDLESFDQRDQRLFQYALAAFLEIAPDAIQIISAKQTNSIDVEIKLGVESAVRLLKSFKDKDPELAKFLASFPLIAIFADESPSQSIDDFKKFDRLPNLYLAPVRQAELDGFLGKLARASLLDVNGTSNLSKRATTEMKFIALLLALGFLFNFSCYTLLASFLLQSGTLYFGWSTGLALILGLIFSSLIWVYERQFMTADFSSAPARQYLLPTILRLAIILTSAFIVSQPFELIAFRGLIQQRVHEESVRLEAVRKLAFLSLAGPEVDAERLRKWLTQLAQSKPGSRVVEQKDTGDRWEFNDEEYTLFERLGVINDLYYGRAARWQMASDGDMKTLEAYGITQVLDSQRVMNPDPTMFKRAYWAILFLPILMGCLPVAMKILSPPELKSYYSLKKQQEAGNYEALIFSMRINTQPIITEASKAERLAS